MNAKIAKKIRKMLKTEGVDVKHSLYNLSSNKDGTGTITLSDNSGRKLYKEAKRSFSK